MVESRIRESWQAYSDAWADVEPAERQRLVETSVVEGFEFSNPQISGRGREALINAMVEFQKQFPGARFEPQTVMIQHGQLLSSWILVGKDGTEMLAGHNYVRADAEGRLTMTAGFFPG